MNGNDDNGSSKNNKTWKRPLLLGTSIVIVLVAIALHGIDHTSPLNLIFPLVMDGVQALFGSSRKDTAVFDYGPDGLPLCNGCHCTPSWDEDPETFKCPTSDKPLPPWQYSKTVMDTLNAQVALNPYSLDCDIYDNATCDTIPSLERHRWSTNAVCGLLYQEPSTDQVETWRKRQTTTLEEQSDCPLVNYTMQTFESAEHALQQRAVVTHTGPCGACSTTMDLSAQMKHPDMVHAGRRCTNRVLLLGHEAGVRCYEALGFTKPCAAVWAYNSYHTATQCRKTCVRHLFSPPNLPEPSCRLNDCLHCDEVKSGPNFVAFAGRNRRNSGLRTPILRQCEGLANIVHDACPVDTVVGTS